MSFFPSLSLSLTHFEPGETLRTGDAKLATGRDYIVFLMSAKHPSDLRRM